jgi:hypothetical protein
MSELVSKAHWLFLKITNLMAPDINYGLKAVLSTPHPERKKGIEPKDTCSIRLEFYPRGKGESSLRKICDIEDLVKGKDGINTEVQRTTQWPNRPVLVVTMPHTKTSCAALQRVHATVFERKASAQLLSEFENVMKELSALPQPQRNDALCGIIRRLNTRAQRHYKPGETET